MESDPTPVERLEKNFPVYRLAVIPGDGIGPEVIREAVKCLWAAADRFGIELQVEQYDFGADRYLRSGEVLTDDNLAELATFDALLLGAVGSPEVQPGVLELGLVVRIRRHFDQYVNVRPVHLLPGVTSPVTHLTPERCDFVILRENTEGMYADVGGVLHAGTSNEIAVQQSINSRWGTERVIRYAFELAATRRGQVTVCHKANILTHAGTLWWRTAQDVARSYPDISFNYIHADAMCLYMLTEPQNFDVVVTDNLFGDLLSDLGAALQGGMGVAPSANLNPERSWPSMFEPVHGSAPDIAGTGKANPVAAILSAATCLAHIGERTAAKAIEIAVTDVLSMCPKKEASTQEIGDVIAEAVTVSSAATRETRISR